MILSGLIDTNKGVAEIKISQIMSFTDISPLPSPESIRQYHSIRRSRHIRREPLETEIYTEFFRSAPQLQSWASEGQSCDIIVCGSSQTRHRTRDFAVGAIDLISDKNIAVVWALKPKDLENYTSMDLLKYLTSQILKCNHSLCNERSAALNAARFQSSTTESQWFDLLGSVIDGLTQLYIIVDLDVLKDTPTKGYHWPEKFQALFEELRQRNISTIVKVAFISSRVRQLSQTEQFPKDRILQIPNGRSSKIQKASKSISGTRSRKKFRKFLPLDPIVLDRNDLPEYEI
jgi:hypothetical protein